jgi:Zn-dependent M28 family amino/carboxypeptidase
MIPAADKQLVARLRSHVNVLAGLIGPRHLKKPSTMEAATAYVERQFGEMGDAVSRQTYLARDVEASNLIVERKGTQGAGKIVVVGAHYDTVATTPGADDNASAVAVMIEVARLLAGRRLKRAVRFVAFACEEPPYFRTEFMGSVQYARECRNHGDKIAGMICLEMMGYYTDKPDSQQIPPAIPKLLQWIFPKKGDFLTAVGNLKSVGLVHSFRRGFKKASSLPLFSIALPELIQEIKLSDNSSFWDQGYPALMITDTSFLRNPNYHWLTDTPETLDYQRMALATVGVAGAVARIARMAR